MSDHLAASAASAHSGALADRATGFVTRTLFWDPIACAVAGCDGLLFRAEGELIRCPWCGYTEVVQ